MQKTQVQIPDELYRRAKALAEQKEISFAEVVRRGLEYITRVYPEDGAELWEPPRVEGVEPDWAAIERYDARDILEEEMIDHQLSKRP